MAIIIAMIHPPDETEQAAVLPVEVTQSRNAKYPPSINERQ